MNTTDYKSIPENYNDPMNLGKRPKSAKSSHYVDNEKFFKTIIEYIKAAKKAKKEKLPLPQIPNYLGECWTLIAWGILKNHHFYKYPYQVKQELAQDAVENCVKYFDRFDPKYGKNPFGYFSLLILRSFYRSIAKEKKILYVKYKESIRRGVGDLLAEVEKELGTQENPELQSSKVYDNIGVFVEKFEDSVRKKKEKAAAKKLEKLQATKKVVSSKKKRKS
jgi:hypothetical protein